MKSQESCKDAWLCAVNTNRNLLKDGRIESTETLKAVKIKQHQDDYQAIKRIKEIVLNKEQILAKDKVNEDALVQRLLGKWKKLKTNSNNILVLSTEEMDEIVIPSSLKWFVYQEFHKKHSPSSLRNMLPPSKVKSLLAKHGKRYQALNRHWVPLFSLTTTKKEQHATPHAPLVTVTSASLIAIDFLKLDKSADKIWLLSSYNRSVHEICTCISYYKQVCRNCRWKTFSWFCVEMLCRIYI